MGTSLEAALKNLEDIDIPDEVLNATPEEINNRIKLIDNEIKLLKSDNTRLMHEHNDLKAKIKENNEKIKLNKQLPYLVGNVVEVWKESLRIHFILKSYWIWIQMMLKKKGD